MRNTTKLAMLSTALLTLVPAAMAQDVNDTGKTDFYLGGTGGLVSGTTTWSLANGALLANQTLNPAELGIVGGFRFNRNDWLMGVEADINANLSNTIPPAPGFSFGFTENDGSAHLRALLGRQMGPMSLFLAGGLAGTHVKYQNVFGTVDDKVMPGWTLGIGAEYAATEHIALRLEAMHDETSTTFSDGYNGKWVENTVRVGAIFKF